MLINCYLLIKTVNKTVNKLLRNNLEEHFYDLQADPYENNNLLEGDLTEEQSENYLALKQQIETLRNRE